MLRLLIGPAIPQKHDQLETVGLKTLGRRLQHFGKDDGRDADGAGIGHVALALSDISFRHIGENRSDERVSELGGDAPGCLRNYEIVLARDHMRPVLLRAAGRYDDRRLASRDRIGISVQVMRSVSTGDATA